MINSNLQKNKTRVHLIEENSRSLDFSTPQAKNMTQNQARSKLFCDFPNGIEKCLEEPSSNTLPKLKADWGSVNEFELMIKKDY